MYKDVWKRVLALVVAVCLIGASIQWPQTVMAAEVKNYHTYQHGGGSTSGWIETNSAAAVFTVGQNASGGAEILDSISFEAHISEGVTDTKATVSYYINPQGQPDSGTFVHSKPITNLTEGTNKVEADMEGYELAAGTTYAVVVSLEGANLAYYGAAGAGQTYVSVGGSWKDASEDGQCVAIRAYTYDVGDDGADGNAGADKQERTTFSLDNEPTQVDSAPVVVSTAELNKVNMTIPVNGYGNIELNDASGTVTWSVEDTSIAEIGQMGNNTAVIKGITEGQTTIIARDGDATYTCTLKVTASMEDAQISLTPENAVYNGNSQIPVIKVMIGETELKENTDYQLDCVSVNERGEAGVAVEQQNIKDAGTYRFIISGQGQYSGNKTIDYVIAPKQVTDETLEVTLNSWDASQPLLYVASVTDNARNESLTPEDATTGDYYLETVANEAGEVTGINIVGRGNYTGSRVCPTPKSIASAQITFDQNAYVYLGREWQPTISVAVDGVILSQSDYMVKYSENINAGTASVKVTGQNGYYGETNVTFEILPKDISNADLELTQSPVEVQLSNAVGAGNPEVAVTYNGQTLLEKRDYTIAFANDATTGIGVCTITGSGNYQGERTEEYAVASGNIGDYADVIEVSDMTYTGEALTPAVVLKKNNVTVDSLREGVDYTVTYSNNVDVGSAKVTVRGIGAYGGKIDGTFEITGADLSGLIYQFEDASGKAVSPSGFMVDYSLNVEDMKPNVIVTNGQGKQLTEGKDYKLTYSITDATVDLSGELTVTVKPADGNTNYSGSKILSYNVRKCNLQKAVESGKISFKLNKESFNYTGRPQIPTETLSYASGDVLEKGRDYTVKYSATDPTEVGEYKVMITGAGNYSGYVEKSFWITSIDIQTLEDITPDTTQEGFVDDYTGTWFAMKWYDSSKANNKLKLIIKDNSGNLLVEGTDYTLSYENIDAVSTSSTFAQVTITGRGTYTGERVIYYLLAGKLEEYALSIDDEKLVYTGEEITLKEENVTVKTGILWWKDVLAQGVDYRIEYEDNINAGTAKFVIEPMDDDALPTENGCYRYTDGISEDDKLHDTFKITQMDIDDQTQVQLENAIVVPYDGIPVTLDTNDIPLTYNGQQLTDADFTIVDDSYVNNDHASDSASVTINGKGNYMGTRVISFVITGKSLDNVQAKVASAIYTGEKLYPEIISLETEDGTPLTKDTHYTYTNADYKNNVNAGEGTITIHGINDYIGSTAEIPFTIDPRDISDAGSGTCTIEGVASSGYTFTSQEIKPEVVVKYQATGTGGKTLASGDDYTVDYRDNVAATSDAAVVITGTGNYTGTVEKTFAILAKSIEDTEKDIIVAPIPSQEYNGGIAVTPVPDITYSYGSGEADVYQLVSDDYTLAYEGSKKVGTAKITITGTGNFTGTREVNYHIGNAITDINKVSIRCPEVENGTSFIYKGSAYEPAVEVTNLTTGAPLEKDKDYKLIYGENTNVGTATVTVEGIGSYAGEKEFTFTITPKSLTDSDVSLAVKGVTDGSYKASYTGNPVEPKVTLSYNGQTIDSGYAVNYGADHTNVGVVNITVTALANSNFTGTKSVQDTPAAKFEIVTANIGNGGSTPASGFTMEVVEPQPLGSNGAATPTPKLYYNGVALAAGIDYTYSYEKNNVIGTNAVVILTGTGNYTGSVRQKFEIRGSIEGAVVEVADEIWYKDFKKTDGTFPAEIEFNDKISVTLDGTKLTEGTDYEISYADNTWVGVAKVTVKGKGTYAGSVTKDVPIKADLSETTITIADQSYTGSPVKVVPIVEYNGTALIEGKHFVIHTYENNTEISDNATVTIIGNEKNGFSGTRTETFSITANAGALTVSGVADSYIYRGKAIEPAVTVKLGNTTLAESDYDVTYGSNTNVGVGTIVVKGKGSYAGLASENILFDIMPQDVNALTVLDGTSNVIADREYTGIAILPELGLTAKVGTNTYTMPESDYTVTAKTDNVSVGTVTLVIEGTGNITGEREVSFGITPKSLSKPSSGTKDTISVEVTQDTYAYDGTAKTPSVVVTYQYGTENEVRTLVKDTDYTVSYSNNVAVGTATVTVSGIGNYVGSRSANFKITEQDISAATVTLPNGYTYSYMGNTVGVEPEVEVTVKGVTLTKDKDYTVTYQNNKACGTATVTVNGKGDFGGSTTANFTIEAHSINAEDVVVADIPNQAYTGSPVVPKLTITCGTYNLVKGVDYELTCTGNTQIGQAAVTIKGINGFKGSRTEIFMIASGIDKAEIFGLKDSYAYTGQALVPEQLGITEVRIGDTILSASDYTVGFAEGSDATSVGTQTVVLTGTGNYGGTKELEITITPKNITDADVVMTGFADSIPYAEELTQNITLTWGTITLQKGTDYEIICSPAESGNDYVMTVTGKGNYTGSIEKNFTVEYTDISAVEIKDMSSTYTYTGSAIEPKPTVKLGNVELKEGVDYKLTYIDNVNAGVAMMCITGTSTHYTGEREIPFTILRRSINHGKFGQIATQIYNGKDIKPVVSVTDSGRTLVENTDYTLMYKNNQKTGTGSVVVAGKGNYTATKTIPFAIRPCDVEKATVTGASSTTVSLNWKSEGIVTGYEIYRAGADGRWQLVGGTKKTTYMDAKLSTGTSYSYKVRAYVVEENETYYGGFSPVVNAVTSK